MLSRFVGWILSLLFSLIAPIVLIVLGALIAGLGIQKDWTWVIYGGGIVALVGTFLLIRVWLDYE